jgi:RNA polymerase sigma-70 factor (ECF subfamily)
VATRQSLLERLRDLNDHDSWREFFSIYGKLIYRAAIKAGLSHDEAEEVLQETIIGVARRMETFRYEPETCSFKGWLMHLTRCRVIDCLRKRRTQALLLPFEHEDIPEVAAADAFERMWLEEWRQNLLNVADQRVRRKINPGHYQIFSLARLAGHVGAGRWQAAPGQRDESLHRKPSRRAAIETRGSPNRPEAPVGRVSLANEYSFTVAFPRL